MTNDKRRALDDAAIAKAITILERRVNQERALYAIDSPGAVIELARLKLHAREREVFAVAFLDSQHRVIGYDEMFFGTVDSTEVHGREIAREALKRNAVAVVLIHNHPSGAAKFSTQDAGLTERLRDTLRLINVTVLDHVLIAGSKTASFAELERAQEREREDVWQRADRERRFRQSAAACAAWARRRKREAAQ